MIEGCVRLSILHYAIKKIILYADCGFCILFMNNYDDYNITKSSRVNYLLPWSFDFFFGVPLLHDETMTQSTFLIAGSLWGESTKALMFSLLLAWITYRKSSRGVGDLKHQDAPVKNHVQSRIGFQTYIKSNQIKIAESHHVKPNQITRPTAMLVKEMCINNTITDWLEIPYSPDW